MRATHLGAALSCLLLAACSAGGGGGTRRDAGGGGLDASPADAGGRADAGPGVDAGPCEAVGDEADNALAPVDIIWVVDSSSSMENEAGFVHSNLNAFADFIAMSGVDFRVVLISDMGFVAPSPRFASDPEHFLFVDRGVSSSAVFARALDQFPEYSSFLRPDAITHMVGVTDDDDDMGAATFVPMMEALFGHPFTFHAIASPEEPNPIPFLDPIPCTRGLTSLPAAAIGDRYYDAARLTGGLTFSICTNDWSALFSTLGMTVAVSRPLPCAYAIPPVPTGMSFDRDSVNVEHTPEGGATRRFPRAADEAACGASEAWYYDDPASPTEVRLCPALCAAVMAGPGRVEVLFGCDSLLI